MKIYCIANQKGGVSKTTTATVLASILARKAPTLLIDMDPSINSTKSYGAQTKDVATIYDVIIDSEKLSINEAIQKTENGDIVASDPLLSKAEKLIDGDVDGLYRLKDALEELNGYEYVVIDTPPFLNCLLYNALIAATDVIIPVTADAYSVEGLEQLYETIKSIKKRQNPGLHIAGLLLTKYSGRSNHERNELTDLNEKAEKMGTKVFKTPIRECVKTREAQKAGKNLLDYAKNCTTALDYKEFVEELGI